MKEASRNVPDDQTAPSRDALDLRERAVQIARRLAKEIRPSARNWHTSSYW